MPRTTTAVLVAAGLLGGLATAPPVRAQEKPGAPEAAAPTKSEEALAFLAEVKAKAAKQEEADAKAAIAKLVEYWKDKDVSAEVKKQIPDALERYARQERVAVQVTAIGGLAELSPDEGAKAIRGVLEKELKAKQPAVDVYGACLQGLKKLADPSKATTGFLSDLLKRKENDVVAKAADAISGYKDAPGKLRRDLLEEVLKTAESSYQASRDGKDSAAVAKWNTIQNGVMSALRALSGQNLPDPVEARRWFNDHKKDPKIWG